MLLFAAGAAFAAAFQEQQSLDFGTLALRSNDAVSTVRLRHRGLPISTGGGAGEMLVVTHGQPGRYRVSGLPAATAVDVEVTTIDEPSLDGQGAGERLQVDAFTFDALRSDATGEAELRLGATLRTSGSGQPYPEGVYRGAVEIGLRYWSLPDQAYIERSFNAFVEMELRSSISAEQLAPLRFGSLTAFPDPDRQAVLRLSPSAAVSISAAAPASIGVIGGAAPGRIRVSGAAPLQLLTVEFQPSEILLSHQGGSAGARFIVGDFTTLPSGLAFKSDAGGTLEFTVGATLRTELTGSSYDEGDYHGVVTVVVNY